MNKPELNDCPATREELSDELYKLSEQLPNSVASQLLYRASEMLAPIDPWVIHHALNHYVENCLGTDDKSLQESGILFAEWEKIMMRLDIPLFPLTPGYKEYKARLALTNEQSY